MSRKNKDDKQNGLMIEYRELGTISLDELCHAVIADIQALKELYNVRFVNGARLRLSVTNEYGEQLDVRRPNGGRVFRIDTHHYRPTCKDYDL